MNTQVLRRIPLCRQGNITQMTQEVTAHNVCIFNNNVVWTPCFANQGCFSRPLANKKQQQYGADLPVHNVVDLQIGSLWKNDRCVVCTGVSTIAMFSLTCKDTDNFN